MIFKVTFMPTGDTLCAGSPFEAFNAVRELAIFNYLPDLDSLLSDFWELLHDFPVDVTVSYLDFSISSDSSSSMRPRSMLNTVASFCEDL